MTNHPSILESSETYLNTSDESHLVSTETRTALVKFIDYMYQSIPVKVNFVEDDPYTSIEDLRSDIESICSFKVWSGGCKHPLWGRLANCKLRAVHDYFDHYVENESTDIAGEYKSYVNMVSRWYDWCSHNAHHLTFKIGALVFKSEMWYQPATATHLGGYDSMPEQKVVLS